MAMENSALVNAYVAGSIATGLASSQQTLCPASRTPARDRPTSWWCRRGVQQCGAEPPNPGPST
jgi:hypothetical protein